MIIDSHLSNDAIDQNSDKLQRIDLVNHLADGYEIYNTTVYSTHELCATIYILRKMIIWNETYNKLGMEFAP